MTRWTGGLICRQVDYSLLVMTQRVKEDALRILRYCRFLPRFEKAGTNAKMVNLLRDNARLRSIRRTHAEELRQIMVGGRVAVAVELMRRAQIDFRPWDRVQYFTSWY